LAKVLMGLPTVKLNMKARFDMWLQAVNGLLFMEM
jgi:hypothetical protein